MTDLYTAGEAIAKLKLPRSTFYYLVEQGIIPRVTVPLRKQAYYPKQVIDALAAEREAVVTDDLGEARTGRFHAPFLGRLAPAR